MEVQDWGGGLTQHEVEAIEKIKQAFQASENNKKVKGQGFDTLKFPLERILRLSFC